MLFPLLRPQRTRAWEGGLRLRAGATALLELAVYRARVQNQLVPFEVATSPGRVFFRNAGLSRHQGVEAAAALEPLPGARLRFAYSYTDARFRVYQVNGQDVSGNPVPGISPHRFPPRAGSAAAGGRSPVQRSGSAPGRRSPTRMQRGGSGPPAMPCWTCARVGPAAHALVECASHPGWR